MNIRNDISTILAILMALAFLYASYVKLQEGGTEQKTEQVKEVDKSIITTFKTKKNGVTKVVKTEKRDTTKVADKQIIKPEKTALTKNYSIRLGVVPNPIDIREVKDYYLGVSRVLFLNVSAEAEYRFKNKDVSLGLRLDF